MHAPFELEAFFQGPSRILVLLIGDELFDENFSRLVRRKFLKLIFDLSFLAGNKRCGFNVKQCRCHKQKVARDFQIELLHAADIGHVLVDDFGD